MFSEISNNGVVLEISSVISAKHAFTTRYGGISSGILSSLNLGENRGDSEDSVRENYRRAFNAIGFGNAPLAVTRQIHGADIRAVTRSDAHTLFTPVPYDADGIMTDERGLVLAVYTADCVPILLCDGKIGAIAAVHAGWRGTVADIAEKAVYEMGRTYGCRPENITAAIGASISVCCFETDAEVPSALKALIGADAEAFIKPMEKKFFVDLKGANAYLLRRAGLPQDNIDISPDCTKCLHEKYWSHRYTNGNRGSMAGFIMLETEG